MFASCEAIPPPLASVCYRIKDKLNHKFHHVFPELSEPFLEPSRNPRQHLHQPFLEASRNQRRNLPRTYANQTNQTTGQHPKLTRKIELQTLNLPNLSKTSGLVPIYIYKIIASPQYILVILDPILARSYRKI